MDSKQKEYLWLFVMIVFYIITGSWEVYDIGMVLLWPLFAAPISLFLIKTGQKEITAIIGVMLALVISLISTSTFNPILIAVFLLFILVPAFVFAMLYREKIIIPRIIMITAIVYFSALVVFFTFAKVIGVDYLESYFAMLDTIQDLWMKSLSDVQMQQLLPEGDDILELYTEVLARAILLAKRTYPATLFTTGLITSTVHLLIVQLIARIRSWDRPAMKEILNVGLSKVAALVLVVLWIITAQTGGADSVWTFAAESMVRVLLVLFQIVGIMIVIVMIRKIGKTKIVRVILSVISLLWLILNPALLIIIACMDSIFNFRKIETFI